MKTILLFLFALPFVKTPAQHNHDNFSDKDNDDTYGIVLKKENNQYRILHINNVNPDAVRYLVNTYENAKDIRWIIDGKITTAEFNLGKKKILLTYDELGDLLSTKETYPGEDLDPFIAKFAKQIAGNDYSPSLVTKVIRKERVIYEINLENHVYWRIIRLKGDTISGFEKLHDTGAIKKS
jgi:hypothetical protein